MSLQVKGAMKRVVVVLESSFDGAGGIVMRVGQTASWRPTERVVGVCMYAMCRWELSALGKTMVAATERFVDAVEVIRGRGVYIDDLRYGKTLY